MIGRSLALALVCVAVCAVPGDAVAHAGDTGSAAQRGHEQGAARTSASAQTQLLLSDMSRPSQRFPEGVPLSWDWATHPRTRSIAPMRDFRAFTAWGQLYQCAGSPATPGATVEVKDLQAWVLLRGSPRWRRIQFSSELGGAAFADDYAGPTLSGRYSASPSGTAAQVVPGHNFHFWPKAGRVSLNASDVAAVTVAVQARLESTQAASATPCLVLSVGGDLWRSLSAQADGSSVGDVGIGRFKRVESQWRLFTMTTASVPLLRQKPLRPISPAATDF